MRVRIIALLVTLLGLTGAASADQVVDGRIGPGALYRLVVPTDDPTDPTDVPWNGNLLLYAHGFVSALEPVPLPPDGELLVSLFAPQGYAVAVSSFSENGWAVMSAQAASPLARAANRVDNSLPRRSKSGSSE